MADTPTVIREAMAERGVTQTTLAEYLGLTQPAVSARLTGRTPITVDELRKIASALGMSAAELLGVTIPSEPPTPDAAVTLGASVALRGGAA